LEVWEPHVAQAGAVLQSQPHYAGRMLLSNTPAAEKAVADIGKGER
jgi:hypothetical protein